jgi:hypothetical protein
VESRPHDALHDRGVHHERALPGGSQRRNAAPAAASALLKQRDSVDEDRGGAGNRIVGGGTERDATGANGMIESDSIVQMTPDSDPWIPFEGDSGTIAVTSHRSLILALNKAIADPATVGDLALARLAAKVLLRVLA